MLQGKHIVWLGYLLGWFMFVLFFCVSSSLAQGIKFPTPSFEGEELAKAREWEKTWVGKKVTTAEVDQVKDLLMWSAKPLEPKFATDALSQAAQALAQLAARVFQALFQRVDTEHGGRRPHRWAGQRRPARLTRQAREGATPTTIGAAIRSSNRIRALASGALTRGSTPRRRRPRPR